MRHTAVGSISASLGAEEEEIFSAVSVRGRDSNSLTITFFAFSGLGEEEVFSADKMLLLLPPHLASLPFPKWKEQIPKVLIVV